MKNIYNRLYTMNFLLHMQGLWKVMCLVISLGFCGMMSSSFTDFLKNMVGKVNEGMCVC